MHMKDHFLYYNMICLICHKCLMEFMRKERVKQNVSILFTLSLQRQM